MKKIYLIISALIVVLLLANVFYYMNIWEQQVNLQKNLLLKQTQVSSAEIERMGFLFESDLNYIIFSENFNDFFTDREVMGNIETKLEFFYSKYETLVSNIVYCDKNNNVYNLFRDRKNKFISDTYVSHQQREISRRDEIVLQNGEYLFYLPVFSNNRIKGNLIVTLDYISAISSVFQKSYMEDIQWQWLIDEGGNILLNNFEDIENFEVPVVVNIANEISEENTDAIQHRVILDSVDIEIISAFIPTRFLRRNFGVIFSIKSDYILRSIITNAITIGSISTLLIFLIVLLFYMHLRNERKVNEVVRLAGDNLKEIIDRIPVSIVIYDEDTMVTTINKTARMMFEGDNEVLPGKVLPDWYISRIKGLAGRKFDGHILNEVIPFKRRDKEHWLLVREYNISQQERKLTLDVIGDVTIFEKSRKQEAIAVKTKSEFLANMSHEIRTPLNGIIGLTDNLDQGNLKVKQKDFVKSIKKSAELLLSIVDDIFTYSKIEAGKMVVDEIPFKFRQEMDHAVKLLTPRANEKGIKINLRIDENIPDKIIGDPFKIRQIINHLGDNAVKFTEKGLINIIVNQLERESGRMKIEFIVEDTGIGIPKENLETIFRSFNQVNGTTARKHEGSGLGTTLSKQMVELLKGEIWAESPSGLSGDPGSSGTRFIFVVDLYSDEKLNKGINVEKITSYSHIRAVVIKDNENYGQKVMEMLKNFGVSVRLNFFQEKTINLIESNLELEEEKFHIIILRDSPSFDAFKLAEEMSKRGLTDKYIVIMTSSNDKKGNYVKCRKLGLDYYIIEPCNGSEMFNIFQENFPGIKISPKNTGQLTRLRKDLKILIAEDNVINQKVNRTFFKKLGYEIEIAENGRIAVDMSEKKEYDIIFMDIMMPEVDGWEATRMIRDRGDGCPIVAITADTDTEAREKAKQEGMNDFIPKPVRIEELKRVLLRWFSEDSE